MLKSQSQTNTMNLDITGTIQRNSKTQKNLQIYFLRYFQFPKATAKLHLYLYGKQKRLSTFSTSSLNQKKGQNRYFEATIALGVFKGSRVKKRGKFRVTLDVRHHDDTNSYGTFSNTKPRQLCTYSRVNCSLYALGPICLEENALTSVEL